MAQPRFAEAVERLRRANHALSVGRASLALIELDELDRFAGDILEQERDLTRILVDCALGEVDDAKRRAVLLLAEHDTSIYAPRIAQSCAGAAMSDR